MTVNNFSCILKMYAKLSLKDFIRDEKIVFKYLIFNLLNTINLILVLLDYK
jgi:hypothetical protein